MGLLAIDLRIAAARARYETLIETTNSLLEIVANAEKEWQKGIDERDEAFKELVSALEEAHDPESSTITDTCDAEDWYYDDDDTPVIRGKCGKQKGHRSRWHCELYDGDKVWCEWSGKRDERAPEGATRTVPQDCPV